MEYNFGTGLEKSGGFLLEVKKLSSGYGKIKVVFDVSLSINKGEIVGLIGHNGAGKTTTLKTIYGVLKPFGGCVTYMNQDITHHPSAINVKRGIRFIPQERFIFDKLTVKENLEVSTYTLNNPSEIESRFGDVYKLFPVLEHRLNQRAGTLSGGERRMLSMGTILLTRPEFIMLDEPSLGLSPVTVQLLMDTIRKLNQNFGMTILLVEQNVKQTFKLSNRVYVMKTGHIIFEEKGEKLLERGQWWDLF